ncbi:MAG: CRTAC1 family protein [Halobacteriales archaeon]
MDRRQTTAVAVVGLLLAVGGAAVVYGGALAEGTADQQFAEVSNSIGFDHFPIQEPDNPPGSGRQGVYVADYDNDNWDDLLIVGGRESPSLYENVGGEFERSGALPEDPLMDTKFKGALFFDYDSDGWRDLLLLAPAPKSSVFLENDNGSYRIEQTGLFFQMPNGATALDYNGDGCLDVFVYQNGDWGDRTPLAYQNPNGTVTTDNGNPNYLLEGDCSSFELAEGAGINGSHWSLAASAVDFDGDGRTDIHVANDFYNDTLYYNEGNGTFERVPLGASTDRNGMSSEVGDVNGDGRPDLFVTNILIPELEDCTPGATDCSSVGPYIRRYVGDRNLGNNLLINEGGRSFVDRASAYGVTKGGWGWAASIRDFDNDGWTELFHATEELPIQGRENLSRTVYYDRAGSGSFQKENASRLGFETHAGRGVATLDHDRDGDLDIVVAEHPENTVFDIHFYENRAGDDENWLQVDVRHGDGVPAIGSRVEVDTGERTVVRWVTPRTDFFSQEARVVHLGLGSDERVERVRVVWPDGTERTISDVEANQELVVSPNGVSRLDGPATDDEGGLLPFDVSSLGATAKRVAGLVGDVLPFAQ